MLKELSYIYIIKLSIEKKIYQHIIFMINHENSV
jgi:hypothetical protein